MKKFPEIAGVADIREPEQNNGNLPDHVEETVRSIVEFKVAHAKSATASERAIERATAAVGRPAFIALFVTLFAV